MGVKQKTYAGQHTINKYYATGRICVWHEWMNEYRYIFPSHVWLFIRFRQVCLSVHQHVLKGMCNAYVCMRQYVSSNQTNSQFPFDVELHKCASVYGCIFFWSAHSHTCTYFFYFMNVILISIFVRKNTFFFSFILFLLKIVSRYWCEK